MLEANDGRPDVPEAIGRARRAMAAGLALWREGLMAESHRYMAEALHLALRPWGTVAPAGDTPAADPSVRAASDGEPALAALARAGYAGVDRLQTALAAPAPTLDDARPPELEWIWDEIERLCRFTLRRLTPQRTRRQRLLYGGSALAALIVVALFLAIKSLSAPTVTASASYPLDPHPPDYAVDGMAATEWLLPDGQPGWLQIAFHSPRRVRSVRLLNSHNRYFMDRAAERVRVTAFSGEWPVATAEGRFDRINIERSALDLPLEAEKVTHLRVEILSYFRTGGGLAEVEVH
jgi:hypothetical protein